MSFGEILKELAVSVNGALGALVVGMDGITVEEYAASGDHDLQTVAVEYGAVLKEVEQVSDSLQLGLAKEFSVTTETCAIIIRKINEEYFLVLMLAPGANVGKGRFKARMSANKLVAEF